MKSKEYTITKHKRTGASITWWEWILSEYSLPDSLGRWQRVRTIANFGHTKNPEHYQFAKKLKTLLESEA